MKKLLLILLLSAFVLPIVVVEKVSAEINPCFDTLDTGRFLTEVLTIPETTTSSLTDGKAIPLNQKLLLEKDIVVYGDASEVDKYHKNDRKNGEPRYIGFTSGGGLYPNWAFPPDQVVTTDITKRSLIYRPWENPTRYANNSYTPVQASWWMDLSREELVDQLTRVQDKYNGTEANPAGTFTKLNNGKDWASFLYDYAIFSQSSTELAPGMITEMHTAGDGSRWYDNFTLDRESSGIIGDLSLETEFFRISTIESGALATIQIKVHNSYNVDLPCTTIAFRFDNDSDAQSSFVLSLPAKGSKLIELQNVRVPAGAQQFIAHVNPSRINPPLEKTFANNRHEWDLIQVIQTPPIAFRDITPYSSTVYWEDLRQPMLSLYELTCSSSTGFVYSGTGTSHGLNGLNPDTIYSCELQAIDVHGNSGGVTRGSFRTLPLPPTGGTGLWQSIGLIREVDQTRQAIGQLPAGAMDLRQYKTSAEARAAANTFSPYFGEKLGVFAVPAVGTTTHSWNFTYSDQEWDSCQTRNARGECVGGYQRVQRSAIDYCVISYPLAVPSGWANLKNNPAGLTLAVQDSWNKGIYSLQVSEVKTMSCTGNHPKNASPVQFTYYMPTEYMIEPSILLNKGFVTATQQIDPAFQNLSLTVKARQTNLSASTQAISGEEVNSSIPFKMMWSRLGSLGTGG